MFHLDTEAIFACQACRCFRSQLFHVFRGLPFQEAPRRPFSNRSLFSLEEISLNIYMGHHIFKQVNVLPERCPYCGSIISRKQFEAVRLRIRTELARQVEVPQAEPGGSLAR